MVQGKRKLVLEEDGEDSQGSSSSAESSEEAEHSVPKADSSTSSSDADSSDEEAEDDSEDEEGGSEGEGEGSEGESSGSRLAREELRRKQTSKASVQDNERTDVPVSPNKAFEPKPMVELKAGSNVWYQAYVIKESANEVKLKVPMSGRGKKTIYEWLKKGSSRIWRGSLKASNWRHLGHGTWEPKIPGQGSGRRPRQQGSGRRTSKQQRKARDSSSGEGTSGSSTEHNSKPAARDDEVASPRPSGHNNTTANNNNNSKQPRGKAQRVHRAVIGADASTGTGSEDAVAGNAGNATQGAKSGHGAANTPAGDAAGPSSKAVANHKKRLRAADAPEPSDAEHVSTHSPLATGSHGACADQNSARAPSQTGEDPGADEVAPKPAKLQRRDTAPPAPRGTSSHGGHPGDAGRMADPLARWFLRHLSALEHTGMLGVIPDASLESGALPPGFAFDPTAHNIVLQNAPPPIGLSSTQAASRQTSPVHPHAAGGGAAAQAAAAAAPAPSASNASQHAPRQPPRVAALTAAMQTASSPAQAAGAQGSKPKPVGSSGSTREQPAAKPNAPVAVKSEPGADKPSKPAQQAAAAAPRAPAGGPAGKGESGKLPPTQPKRPVQPGQTGTGSKPGDPGASSRPSGEPRNTGVKSETKPGGASGTAGVGGSGRDRPGPAGPSKLGNNTLGSSQRPQTSGDRNHSNKGGPQGEGVKRPQSGAGDNSGAGVAGPRKDQFAAGGTGSERKTHPPVAAQQSVGVKTERQDNKGGRLAQGTQGMGRPGEGGRPGPSGPFAGRASPQHSEDRGAGGGAGAGTGSGAAGRKRSPLHMVSSPVADGASPPRATAAAGARGGRGADDGAAAHGDEGAPPFEEVGSAEAPVLPRRPKPAHTDNDHHHHESDFSDDGVPPRPGQRDGGFGKQGGKAVRPDSDGREYEGDGYGEKRRRIEEDNRMSP